MKNKKMKTMIASLALVGVVGLGSTLAYLSDKSNTLTNTFTVGSGYIPDEKLEQAVWIDETKVGTPATNEKMYEKRTLEGNKYEKVLAGSTLTKDPILRVNKGSVKSYGYLKVEGLDALKDKGITTTLNTTDWTKVKIVNKKVVADTSDGLDGIYIYGTATAGKVIDPTNAVAATTPLFSQLTVATNFDGKNVTLDNVLLKGCAVQAVTFNDGKETPIALADSDAPAFE